MAKKRKRGDRFPLLIYEPVGRRWGRLGLLLILASLGLWLALPRLIGPTMLRHLALFPVLVGLILIVYGQAARKMAYIQCFPTRIRIQTPIYPLVISYKRIETTRPVQLVKLFDPQKEKAARRSWPKTYWSKTAIVLELKGYPISESWLRLWFNRYMFWPEGTGLVLLVEDWMEFSQQLDGFRSKYRAWQAQRRVGRSRVR